MRLILACLVAGLLTAAVTAAGIPVRAADVGVVAVDEPQYLLTAISLWEDGDLDISDERAQGRAGDFHDGPLPVQTAVLDGGARVSPHDPLLPLLLAPAVGLGGWVGAKILLSVLAGVLAAATAWVIGTRWAVSVPLAGTVAAVAGTTTPLAVYGHQVYPELPAALAVVLAVGAILPRREGRAPTGSRVLVRVLVIGVAISALPWLAVKYTPVAAALAVVALLRLRRESAPAAGALAGGLALSGVGWLAGHRVLYGGWTAYATGDHFQASGEFGAVGFAPDLLGRSTRLVGLLVDRDYGLVAWAPAWLLAVPALGLIWGAAATARSRSIPRLDSGPGASAGAPVLIVPLLAGWFTAVFLALTMHGYWWPGRQVVIVLPLAAMLVALALSRRDLPARRAVHWGAGLLAATGVAVQAWVLFSGYSGTLTWVGAPDLQPPAPLALLRGVLPDYRQLTPTDWAWHGLWAAAASALLAGGGLLGRHLERAPAAPAATPTDDTPTDHGPTDHTPTPHHSMEDSIR